MRKTRYPLQQTETILLHGFIFGHHQYLIKEGINGWNEFDDDIQEFIAPLQVVFCAS